MKKIKSILMIALMLCVIFPTGETLAQNTGGESAKVDVYYFHATKRCPTCNAIESETVKTLNGSFAQQMENGTVRLHVLNLDEKENRELVEKYEIYGSSLILVPASGDEPVNLTNKAFLYAKDQAFAFRKELREQLNKLLEN